MKSIIQSFTVGFDFPVHFTRDLFSRSNPVLVETVTRLEPARKHRVFFVIDDNVAAAHPELTAAITSYVGRYPGQLKLPAEPWLVPGGEQVKNDLSHVLRLVEKANEFGLDRQSFLAVIGGGAVLDMACFAAALSHRGIRAIRIPTTVLSQNDSGVGVKNGVNMFGKKNFIGTFVPPFAVINDFEFLRTLDLPEVVSGLAEAVKVGLIRDREFFEKLETDADRLARGEMEVLIESILRSAEHHLEHIRTNGDPFEFGSARPLDFGHWAAHKLESLTGNRLRHGEAVGLGIALDTIYSWKAGFLDRESVQRVLMLLARIGLPLWDEALKATDQDGKVRVMQGLQEFREHLGGELHISLLAGIGRSFEVTQIDESLMLESLRLLESFSCMPELQTAAPLIPRFKRVISR